MSFRFLLRPKWLFWVAFAAVAVVVMVNLGLWQLDRHDGRQEANRRIEARIEEPVVPVGELLAAGEPPVEGDDRAFRRVRASGTYDREHEVLIANRTLDGLAGWWVVTPLVLDDGTALAVNRGWIPLDVGRGDDAAAHAPPDGPVEVVGVLQATQARQAGPSDQPGVLPRVNLALLDERVPAGVLPLWLQLEQQQPGQAGSLPAPLPQPELTDGPHLGYAGQWFVFALLTVVVVTALVVRTARSGAGGDGASDEAEPSPAVHGAGAGG